MGIKIKPYYSFEIKNRGVVFLFKVEENTHLINVKLIGETFSLFDDTYIIIGLEKVITEIIETNDYGILTNKIMEKI